MAHHLRNSNRPSHSHFPPAVRGESHRMLWPLHWETLMKRSIVTALGLALLLASSAGVFAKDEKKSETKTITGKSGCAECEGVVKHGDAMHIMLTDKAGTR